MHHYRTQRHFALLAAIVPLTTLNAQTVISHCSGSYCQPVRVVSNCTTTPCGSSVTYVAPVSYGCSGYSCGTTTYSTVTPAYYQVLPTTTTYTYAAPRCATTLLYR
ncbi:hypothetical protein D5085_06790 [Ectothiorhodospiraceae bacterium BW-2]|nr:hypothetical protein D5085_06790 [Ectothiorhodospiraceae bacterium BW-2]